MDGPTTAMFLAMFATMTSLIVGSIWNLHRESRAARRENTGQIEGATSEFARQIGQTNETVRRIERTTDKLSAELAEHKRITAENHRSTQRQLSRIDGSLSDARERLARIEGHLGIGSLPPNESETGDADSDAA